MKQNPGNIIPPFLKEGDKVALVSPCYRLDPVKFQYAVEFLRGWNLEPVLYPRPDRQYKGPYAGSPSERLAELEDAFRNPEIRAVFCSRGGYGGIQLLSELPGDLFSADPKWLVGFSDITNFLAASLRQGVASVHGPMGSTFNDDPVSDAALKDLLFGTLPRYTVPADPRNCPGSASGILVGGNMTSLIPLLGTPWDPIVGDTILYIEEIGETLHHIDRMWNTIALHGELERVRALIVGSYTESVTDIGFESAEEVIGNYADSLGIPVIYGFPAGHTKKNLPLLYGGKVSVESGPEQASVLF